MAAFQSLRRAYNVDVSPILALARVEAGEAADPIAANREPGWRARKARGCRTTTGVPASSESTIESMHAAERERLILQMLRQRGFIAFQELDRQFEASSANAR